MPPKSDLHAINERKATLIARDIIEQSRGAVQAVTAGSHPEMRVSKNVKVRQRQISRILKHYLPMSIGVVADSRMANAACALAYPIPKNPRRIEGIAVYLEHFNLMPSGERKGVLDPADAFHREPVAHVDIHVMKRLIQRRGCRGRAELLGALNGVLGWSLAAERANLHGNFTVHTADGLFCCERSSPLGGNAPGHAAPVVRIKTFLVENGMSAANRAAKRLLEDIGAPQWTPRFPIISPPSPEQITALRVMRQIGKEWEDRNHLQRNDAAEPEDRQICVGV